ncbi:DEXDc helicase [Bodo saltans virus]|uniref:DEXDc helicase n=1 Tax=Bodo saltans virus TaxID=2024608 RepID=A0A2H4UVQ8_9VIRU|nr:DEXDc helicase [Bodo saltans virus]ATZ81012.1 DEXDc helicase [Bodo saltans virus]
MAINIMHIMSKEEYNSILLKYFGHESLKELQYEAIKSCIENKDTIGILPTSYGKSIIYQMVHVITKKNVLVVSPLISLMSDQLTSLKKLGIDAICLNSQNKQKDKDIADVYNGNSKLIYTSPEYIVNNTEIIENLVFVNKLALVVIDECHCVIGYGHSFRNDYLHLNCIKEIAPDVPVIALTGTATQIMINDIEKKLKLIKPNIIRHTMDRQNLYIAVSYRDDTTFDIKIKQLLEKHDGERCIIYCKTTVCVDKITDKLNNLGIKCEGYHGKKNDKERTKIQKHFTDGTTRILVSTIAFGMGINIPDIRVIIHYNCSNDVDSYTQEIGRAGRDGKPSYCYMFYNNQDFVLSYNFASEISNYVAKTMKEKEIGYLKKYVTSSECRRKILLQYYGETFDDNCGNCDNCTNNKFQRDFTQEALLLFGLMQSINVNLGTNTYVKILLGSKDKTASKYISDAKQYHGKGYHYKEDWWKKFICVLVSNGYILEEKIKSFNKFACAIILKPTIKATKWFGLHKTNSTDKENLILTITDDFKKIDAVKTTKLENKIAEFKKTFGDRIIEKNNNTISEKYNKTTSSNSDSESSDEEIDKKIIVKKKLYSSSESSSEDEKPIKKTTLKKK